MRERRTSGFVRGAHSNMCPYRDPHLSGRVLISGEMQGDTPNPHRSALFWQTPYLPFHSLQKKMPS
jgi:hypothetical protein